MRLALDARRLQDQPYTGVGRRLANLLPYLADQAEIVLLTDARYRSPDVGPYEEVRLSLPPRVPGPFWLQIPVARWLRSFDGVFHGTYNATPFGYRGPAVVTLHDLSWEHHAEDASAARQFSFRIQARWSARHCGAVIAVSEFMRRDIINTYQLPPRRVITAPPAVDPLFSPDRAGDVEPVLARLGIESPYLVAIGGAKRRGLEVAVEAWRRLPAPRPPLVVVGSEAPSPIPGLVHAGRVSDHEWSALLAGAMAFCYPTRYEGYGMPALEAAASGVPVVCGRVGPLPEVLGEAAEWCATAGVDDIALGLERVVGDPSLRSTRRAAGLARASAAPTWEQCAQAEMTACRLALSESAP